MQGKRLRLWIDTVDAVFRYDAVVIPDVKTDHRMINAVARADSGNDDLVSTRAEVKSFQNRFHRCFIKTIVRGFLNDILPGQGF